MGFRRKARAYALQMLFQIDFTHDIPKENILPSFWSDKDALPQIKAFAECLVHGVIQHQARIDALIQKHTEHWSTGRMATIDRNILRFSVYELCYLEEIPPKVTINEAIEIAKRYGNEDSGAFINGILDRIHQSLLQGDALEEVIKKN
ncbi:MAG: transcription antitermination factor NusB [Nitrospiria bacterium]